MTILTSGAHRRLRAHLGLPDEVPPTALARRFDTVIPDDAMMQCFGADARPLMLGGSVFQAASEFGCA